MKSDIRSYKNTDRENECRLDPWSCDILDGLVVFFEVFFYSCRGNLHDEFSDIFPLEHHEECRDGNEPPVGNYTTYSRHYRYTTTCEWANLCCDNWLDIAGILLDDIEYVFDIVLTQDEEDDFLDIWMKIKSMNTITEIYSLRAIDPIDDYSCSISDVLDDNRYECPDNNTTKEKYNYIYPYECHPRWYSVFFTDINQGIHNHGDKSCYYENEKNSWYSP